MNYSYLLTAALMLATSTTAYSQVKVKHQDARPQNVAATLLNTNASRTVLATKKVANGIEKRVVRDGRGRVFIDMVRDGKVSAAPQSLSLPRLAADNASLYEGFEGHQGEPDWLPKGWTEVNTEANIPTLEMCAHNINNSWSVQNTGDGYWTDVTTDGVKEAWIHFTYDWKYTDSNGETVSGGPGPQDEWLITPAIDVKAGENLYFLAEVDLGAIYPFSWSSMEYDLTSDPECDLEVLVSTDDGANWTKVWSVSGNVCSTMTSKEMYDVMDRP